MNELKTLKDINSNFYFKKGIGWREIMVHKGDLRKEAINHIKDLLEENIHFSNNPMTGDNGEDIPHKQIELNESVIYWIKNFFNITDEDLK